MAATRLASWTGSEDLKSERLTMFMILWGGVMAVTGAASLSTSRKHPERVNSGVLRGVGYVGITCGAITVACGLLELAVGSR